MIALFTERAFARLDVSMNDSLLQISKNGLEYIIIPRSRYQTWLSYIDASKSVRVTVNINFLNEYLTFFSASLQWMHRLIGPMRVAVLTIELRNASEFLVFSTDVSSGSFSNKSSYSFSLDSPSIWLSLEATTSDLKISMSSACVTWPASINLSCNATTFSKLSLSCKRKQLRQVIRRMSVTILMKIGLYTSIDSSMCPMWPGQSNVRWQVAHGSALMAYGPETTSNIQHHISVCLSVCLTLWQLHSALTHPFSDRTSHQAEDDPAGRTPTASQFSPRSKISDFLCWISRNAAWTRPNGDSPSCLFWGYVCSLTLHRDYFGFHSIVDDNIITPDKSPGNLLLTSVILLNPMNFIEFPS